MASRYAGRNGFHQVGGEGPSVSQPLEEGEVIQEIASGNRTEMDKGDEIQEILASATALYEYGPTDNLEEYEVTPINVINCTVLLKQHNCSRSSLHSDSRLSTRL